ncbi:MAG: F-type H+-transporting ATPase subunit delta [Pseudomonadota bacterium]|nr:F-type H+-transporting ATPase subunit delta [Pseudomonadota bacterium]
MKDLQTIARPYAKALFELALKHQCLNEWHDALAVLSQAVAEQNMQRLLGHPEVTSAMLVDILSTVVQGVMKSTEQLKLLVQALEMMAEHQRLSVIPEVYRQFDMLNAEHHKMCSGIVYSAIALDDNQMSKLVSGLQKKLNKTVNLSQIIQPELLGGAKIEIGDMVIDGTLRGRIQRLAQSMYSAS